MALKDTWNILKKGVKAGIMAIKQSNALSDEKAVMIIQEFNTSKKLRWMKIGERYYEVEHEIANRKHIKKTSNGQEIEETYKANNKLAHGLYKNMVDEKVSYLLAKDYTLKSDDEGYLNKIKDILNQKNLKLKRTLFRLGYEASNKGIGWLHVYINEQGQLKTMVVPSEQCIPVWKDNAHEELEMMIRVYKTYEWVRRQKVETTNVEVWTDTGLQKYILTNDMLIPSYDDNGGPIAHYYQDGQPYAWGKIPFIAFKNNFIEMPDIKFVKSLLDNYDLSRSEAANYLEDVKNLIFILKGYGGQDMTEFMRRLNEDRAIPIDDPESGGVDVLNPTLDITSLKEHFNQLKSDILEVGQSVNKDLDKFGNNPSGVALRFMFSGLDLKANAMEMHFKLGFEELLYFIDIYLNASSDSEVEIVFNRGMEINESEVITNCVNSKGVVSEDTILANHPWVKDVETEKAALEEETQANMPFQDKVPIVGGSNGQ